MRTVHSSGGRPTADVPRSVRIVPLVAVMTRVLTRIVIGSPVPTELARSSAAAPSRYEVGTGPAPVPRD